MSYEPIEILKMDDYLATINDVLVFIGSEGEEVVGVTIIGVNFDAMELRGPIVIGPKYSNTTINHDIMLDIARRQGVLCE